MTGLFLCVYNSLKNCKNISNIYNKSSDFGNLFILKVISNSNFKIPCFLSSIKLNNETTSDVL